MHVGKATNTQFQPPRHADPDNAPLQSDNAMRTHNNNLLSKWSTWKQTRPLTMLMTVPESEVMCAGSTNDVDVLLDGPSSVDLAQLPVAAVTKTVAAFHELLDIVRTDLHASTAPSITAFCKCRMSVSPAVQRFRIMGTSNNEGLHSLHVQLTMPPPPLTPMTCEGCPLCP